MPKKILYAVLNWGLGHASRSIPLIHKLIEEKNKIVIASDGEALFLLQKEFPELIFEKLTPYQVHYAKNAKAFDKTIFVQLPKLGAAIKKEHKQTAELIKKHDISQIVSDNRYGVYSEKIPSSIICHQLTLQHKSSFTQKIMNQVHFKLLNKFQEVWVPDFEGNRALAGSISKTENKALKAKTKYIGILSRMQFQEERPKYDIAIILSGPEPQRSILEEILYEQAKLLKHKIVLVRGISNPKTMLEASQNIDVYNLLKTNELNQIINQSKRVVCRAGYSSIMDLATLNKPALLIPTPGQTEQEYLAVYLKENLLFNSVQQDKINLNKDLKAF